MLMHFAHLRYLTLIINSFATYYNSTVNPTPVGVLVHDQRTSLIRLLSSTYFFVIVKCRFNGVFVEYEQTNLVAFRGESLFIQ